LSFSFQLGFNASVVSRSYALVAPTIFAFLVLLPHYRKHPWLSWCLLAIFANIHIYCVPLSLCFALAHIHYSPDEARPIRGLPIYLLGIYYCLSTTILNWNRLFSILPFLLFGLPLAIGFVLWLGSVARIPGRVRKWLAPALCWSGLGLIIWMFRSISKRGYRVTDDPIGSLSALGRGIIPIVNPFQDDYWHLAMPSAIGSALFLLAAIVVLDYFRKEPFILSLLGLQAVFMLLTFTFLLKGQTWHASILFVGVLGFIWMGRYYRLLLGPSWLLLLIFLPQAAVGVNAMLRSKAQPLSNCYATARWIESQNIDPEHLIGFSLFPTLGVAAYLDETIYFLETRSKVAYSTWNESMRQGKANKRIFRRMQELNLTTVYLVTRTDSVSNVEDALNDDERLRYTEVFRSSGAVRGEFVVLKIERSTRSSDPKP
jgi:hypothetical protein